MNTYKRLNDDINLDNYMNAIDSQLAPWLANSNLKRKELQQVRTAVQELASCIRDGSCTYELGGGFANSRGINNAEDGEFDAYGIAAGYLGDILRKQEVYKSPDPKVENRSLIGDYIKKQLGGDNFTLDYFKKLDKDQLKNIERTKALRKVLENIRNSNESNSIFTQYKDQESWNKDYDAIKHIFEDNVISDNEYLELGKLTGISDLSDWFSLEKAEKETPKPATPATPATPAPTTPPAATPATNNVIQLQRSNKYKTIQWKIGRIINLLPNNEVKNLINKGINGQALNAYRGFTKAFNGIQVDVSNAVIMNLIMKIAVARGIYTSDNFGNYNLGNNYFYNENNNTIYKKLKEGGKILKFLTGGVPSTTRTPLSELVAYDPNLYETEYDIERGLINSDFNNEDRTPFVTKGASGDNKYKVDPRNNRELAKVIEANPYFIQFGKDLFNEDGTFTPVGEAFSKATDAMLPEGSRARIYDDLGNIRTEWRSTGLNTYGERPKREVYTTAQDYLGNSRNDNQLSVHHNVFAKKGERFYRKDGDKEIWVSPEDAKNYNISKEARITFDNGTYWSDYLVTEPQDDKVNETGLPKPKDLSWIRKTAEKISPAIINSLRLSKSLSANERIADTITKAMKPVLEDNYELYHRVTGDNASQLYYNDLGNQFLRQANNFATSDPHQALAGMFEGQRNANEYFTKGYLTDNAEIRRTLDLALSRVEDNTKRRTNTFNKNIASILANNERIANTEAIKLNKNWQGIDAYLSGIETRMRDELDEKNDWITNFRGKVAYSNAKDWYDKVTAPAKQAYAAFVADPSNTGKTWDRLSEYVAWMGEAKNRMEDMLDAELAKIQGYAGYKPKYNDNNTFTWI